MGKAKTDKADGRVALPADCRIADLPAVKDALQAALAAPTVALDGGAVERVDTAALQLLAVFRREAAVRNVAVAWLGASAALRDGAARLGLERTLELPAATPA
jgi:ABC-type transporter Mla MlaB component